MKPREKKSQNKFVVYRIFDSFIKSYSQQNERNNSLVMSVKDIMKIRMQTKQIKTNLSSIELDSNKEIYLMRGKIN